MSDQSAAPITGSTTSPSAAPAGPPQPAPAGAGQTSAEGAGTGASPAPAASTTTAPAPAPSAADQAPTMADLQAQIAALTAAFQAQAQSAPTPAPSAAPAASTHVVHLSKDEVPAVGEPITFRGRTGIVLEVLESERKDNAGNVWTQYSCRVGLFREATIVDAELLERL